MTLMTILLDNVTFNLDLTYSLFVDLQNKKQFDNISKFIITVILVSCIELIGSITCSKCKILLYKENIEATIIKKVLIPGLIFNEL